MFQPSHRAMPVIRIGNTLIFPGGRCRQISRLDQLLYKARVKRTVRLDA